MLSCHNFITKRAEYQKCISCEHKMNKPQKEDLVVSTLQRYAVKAVVVCRSEACPGAFGGAHV